MNPEQNLVPTEDQARVMREAMRPAPPPKIDPEAMRNAAPMARRIRRTRKYGGWRARLSSWLRAWADRINPLED